MIYEKLNIWDSYDGKMHTDATMSVYVPDVTKEIDLDRKFKAVLICPGGGYTFTSDREAEPVALAFLAKGIAAFVLRYSVAPAKYPTALLEASRAMWLIRQNSDKWHINTDDIAICGFSAGGHLAASLGTLWNEKFIADELGMPEGANKPNKLILGYPVIIYGEGRMHCHSFYNLLGENLPDEDYLALSLEKRVGPHTPPSFIWHTFSDSCVPVDSSLGFALALRKNKIPFEMHIYPEGDHGSSLCDSRTAGPQSSSVVLPYVANWIDHCTKWMLEY